MAHKGDTRFCSEEIQLTNKFEKERIIPALPKNIALEFKNVKSIIKYTNLKIQDEALGRILGRSRIDCTVIFTSYVEVLDSTVKTLEKQGFRPMAVYGKTNNELTKIIHTFESDKTINPLVATYASLSTAVPLVMADTMIAIDVPFRAYIHEQAISRIHRLGADTQTRVFEMYLDTGEKSNVSTRSSDILQWSQKQVEDIMGIESPFEVVEEESGRLDVSVEGFGCLSELSDPVFWKDVPMQRIQTSYLNW
jgi:hypothetical protein